MPGSNQNQASPFEIVTPKKAKKGGNRGLVIAVLIVAFLILSVIAGVLLVRQRQLVQEQAAANKCPQAEACPFTGQPSLLRNCHPAESDGSPTESLCNQAGRVEFCGTQNFCCPAPNSSWTTNMSACATPTPTPTASPTPTPTPTASPAPGACNDSCTSDSSCSSGLVCSSGTCRNPLCSSASSCVCGTSSPTPTASSTATAAPTTAATNVPIPVTGVDWPTVGGVGIGAAAIILSILIAL